MTAPLKLGIVGSNFVASWLCEAARALEGVTLYAIYSRSEEKGRAFAEREGVLSVYTDFDAFLASGIEAVYLASPTYCHFDMAKKALESGLHVLVEKPMVTHSRQFEVLCALAEEKGLVLLEAMRPAHDEAFTVVKEALLSLGKIRRVSFEFCQYSSRYDAFLRGEVLNAFTPEIAGAALLDIGIYPLFWAVALFGEPTTVTASSSFLENGFEGGGTVLLGYGDLQVSVTYSKVCSSVTPSAIVGEKGALTVDKVTSPEKITLILRGEEATLLPHPSYTNNLVCELKTFLSLIGRGGDNPYLDISRRLYQTVERIYKAANIHIFE